MAETRKLNVGDRAPLGVALDDDGREIELSRQWADGPVLLTFLRHFG